MAIEKYATDSRLSVIIPTWNEAVLLPGLVRRLRKNPRVSEIIVADYRSEDNTASLAASAGCITVPGGRPAFGRNAGALSASEEILLFVDADVVMSDEVIEAVAREMSDPKTTLVFFPLTPMTPRRQIKIYYGLANTYARLSCLLGVPQAPAPVIGVRRSVFQLVGRFDESVHAAEDVEFVRRVGRRLGGVRYVGTVSVLVSARRFDLEWVPFYLAKCLFWGALRFAGSRKSGFKYSWLRYPDQAPVELS